MRISISVPRRVCVVLLLVVVGAVAVVLLVPSDWRDETLLIPLRTDIGFYAPEEEGPVDLLLSPNITRPFIKDSLRLTCIAKGARKVYFDLPKLERKLLKHVTNQRQYGRAVLTFGRVELGHQGTYVCHAVNRRGDRESRTFDMVVYPEERPWKTTEELAQYQRDKVDDYCKKYGFEKIRHTIPNADPLSENHNIELYSFNRHLLVDRTHKILFCFVPKVGCTNLKLLWFVNQGMIGRLELSKEPDDVDQIALEDAMRSTSFISIYDDAWKLNALDSYFKYVMFRNPLERLVSSYHDKVERFPLFSKDLDKPPFNWLRKTIYEHVHPIEYEAWVAEGANTTISIAFADFIQHWVTHQIVNAMDTYLDEHFLLMSDLSQPCRTRFDFYGNFRHFNRDAQVLIDKIGASSSDLRQSYYSDDSSSTDQRMKLYYSTLSETQKRDVLRKMALDLEFHYTIFPEERDSHKQILEVDYDLEL